MFITVGAFIDWLLNMWMNVCVTIISAWHRYLVRYNCLLCEWWTWMDNLYPHEVWGWDVSQRPLSVSPTQCVKVVLSVPRPRHLFNDQIQWGTFPHMLHALPSKRLCPASLLNRPNIMLGQLGQQSASLDGESFQIAVIATMPQYTGSSKDVHRSSRRVKRKWVLSK